MKRPPSSSHHLRLLCAYDWHLRAFACLAIFLLASLLNNTHAQRMLLPDAVDSGDRFGAAVALNGDMALVGARGDDDAGAFSGAAYLFRRTGEEWVEEAELSADNPSEDDFFGIAVALSDSRAFVGALEGSASPGAVYVFRDDGGTWVREARLSPGPAAERDDFGQSIAADGDFVLIGADEADEGIGAAYVFHYNGAAWVEEAKLTVPDLPAGTGFGAAVALSEGRALIGTPFSNDPAGGVVYLFERGEMGWQRTTSLIPFQPATHNSFGSAVALGSTVAVVGAPSGMAGNGGTFVFRSAGTTWPVEQELEPSAGTLDDEFGEAVAISQEEANTMLYPRGGWFPGCNRGHIGHGIPVRAR